MAVGGKDDTDNSPSGPTDNNTQHTLTIGSEANQLDPEERNESVSGNSQTKFIVYTTGSIGLTEKARQAGIDRHAEAGFAERATAETYAKKVGGTVAEVDPSAYTPDGGIDAIVETADGIKRIQVKHYEEAVRDSTLDSYNDTVDVFGPTNGVAENVDTTGYEDITTYNDWSLKLKIELEIKRIKRGYYNAVVDGIGYIRQGIRAGTVKTNNLLTTATDTITNLARKLAEKGVRKAVLQWWKKRSVREKLAIVLGTVMFAAVIYYGLKKYDNCEDADSFFEWLSMDLPFDLE